MKKAFSLIELLVSLIVISLIMSAFVPIITKKIKHKEVAYSNVKQITIDCTKFDTSQGNCLLCDEKQCNLCSNSINVPDGYYINPNESCDKKLCNSFDINCKRCTKDGCQECANKYILNSNKRCVCDIGFHPENGICVQDDPCKAHNAVLIENPNKTVRFCMKKRNAGDEGGPDASGYSGCRKTGASSCTLDDSTASGFTYSGCSRTVCGWNEANSICTNIGWKLPSTAQLDILKTKIASEIKANAPKNVQKYNPQGLQLCDNGSKSAGSPYCKEISSLDSDCIWSSAVTGSSRYNYCLNSGALARYTDGVSAPRSVRCVLDL